jgi:serine protease AprX
MNAHPGSARLASLAAAGVLMVLVAAAGAAEGLPSDDDVRLRLVNQGGKTAVSVELRDSDGGTRRHLVRETEAAVRAGALGSDPAGRTRFVDWSEGGERWFSYSTDGGQSWSEARRVETALRLHAGAIEPGKAMPAVPSSLALPDHGHVYLVQFRTLSLPAWRDAVTEAGAEILAFFPHNAHIVRMDRRVADDLARLPFVERIELYHPSYRLEDELRDWLMAAEAGAARAEGPRRVNVLAFGWGPEALGPIAARAESLGAKVASSPTDGQLVELWVDADQLRQLAADDNVAWVDTWHEPGYDMNLVREDSGANFIESNFNQCGQGVRGEVMDGGVERTHQDFDGILIHGTTGVASHGTATYGIVFGNGNRDGDGDARATGHVICQAQGIFASNNFSNRFTVTQELKRAPFFGSFQSNSWGSGLTRAYTSTSSQMDDIIWRLDIAIAQSQSNTGTQDSRPQAWAKNIISVGGVRHRNTLATGDDAWAGGASIGPAADGRIKPDVHYWYDSIFTTTTGNSYTSGFGGTSAATPEVAGVIGLMVQLWSDNVWNTNPVGGTVFERQPHASTIKALLVNNAKQYAFSGTTHDLTRTHQGWGRPNVQIARQRAANSFIVNEGTPLTMGQAATYAVDVPAGESELKITMVYPDPPGTTSATLHRINDLSLKVTSPNNTVFHGNNGLAAGNVSTPGGSPNTVDTVENVFITAPAAGRWTIEVRAAEINQDAHPATSAADAVFALVVTGARRAGGEATVVFEDNFETDKGWTRNPSNTDTATTGQWERGNPEDTNSNGIKQLGTTTSGVNDLVTARLAGASAGVNDIDGGVTSIRSPAITLPASGTITLSFSYYLAHGSNSSSADFLRVRVVGGTTATVFEKLGAAANVNGAWANASVSLNGFAGQSVRILIEAADASGASLVEAGIDDVKVTRQ